MKRLWISQCVGVLMQASEGVDLTGFFVTSTWKMNERPRKLWCPDPISKICIGADQDIFLTVSAILSYWSFVLCQLSHRCFCSQSFHAKQRNKCSRRQLSVSLCWLACVSRAGAERNSINDSKTQCETVYECYLPDLCALVSFIKVTRAKDVQTTKINTQQNTVFSGKQQTLEDTFKRREIPLRQQQGPKHYREDLLFYTCYTMLFCKKYIGLILITLIYLKCALCSCII